MRRTGGSARRRRNRGREDAVANSTCVHHHQQLQTRHSGDNQDQQARDQENSPTSISFLAVVAIFPERTQLPLIGKTKLADQLARSLT
jgi:hypothetical protein